MNRDTPGDAPEMPEFLPISMLNALVYCPRRFMYEFARGEMAVNEHVLEGRVRHQTVDAGGSRTDDETLTRRSVYVFSTRLRISGIADLVEAERALGATTGDEAPLEAAITGLVPVEYKKGSPGGGGANDHVQLCAQGLCLEERTGLPIAGGFIFSFRTMHRAWVPFTSELRAATEAAIARAFALLAAGVLPPPLPESDEKKCHACSLEPLCLPREVRALSRLAPAR